MEKSAEERVNLQQKNAIEKEEKIFQARNLEQYYAINDAIHLKSALAGMDIRPVISEDYLTL